ncbi:hypothetical protein BDW69DRAFT_73755 [Aspergillus filifer]
MAHRCHPVTPWYRYNRWRSQSRRCAIELLRKVKLGLGLEWSSSIAPGCQGTQMQPELMIHYGPISPIILTGSSVIFTIRMRGHTEEVRTSDLENREVPCLRGHRVPSVMSRGQQTRSFTCCSWYASGLGPISNVQSSLSEAKQG